MKKIPLLFSLILYLLSIQIVNASPVPLCNDGSRMFNHKVISTINIYAPQYHLHELEHHGKTKDNLYDSYYTYLGAIEHAATIMYFDDNKIYTKMIKVRWMRDDKLSCIAAAHAMAAIENALDIQRPELIILQNRILENGGGGFAWCPNLRKTIIKMMCSDHDDPRYNICIYKADSREVG